MRIPKGTLPAAVFRERRERLLEVFDRKKIDAYFFSSVADLYYLTGFHSEGFYGLVTGKGTWLFASALLAGQVRENAPGCRLVIGKRLSFAVADLAKKYRLKTLGFDADQLNFRLGDVLKKKGLAPCPNPLEELRAIKGEEELNLLRKACQITAQSVAFIKPRLRPGMTEKEMAWAIEQQFVKRGAHGLGFDLIAAVGVHTSLPHHIPGDAILKANTPVLFDVGCRVGAYRSDLTRSFFYGKIPSSYRRIFDVVLAAQAAGISKVRPGATGGEVDAATRGVISKAGYGRTFVHSTGHGVGIDIHEPPWIRPKSPDVLAANMLLTVEPGIYLPGRFGVRIEDTLRVSPTGHEILTQV
ncbi:MAG: aminopeptidase P family protein [Elusimicrobia bacterium]|jgi:Xaa-Pro aminopeptidase|nr:aminopeptidase P family protein [Elusimicrobiota bacterium]